MTLDNLSRLRLQRLCDAKGCRLVDAEAVVNAVFSKFRSMATLRDGATIDGRHYDVVHYARHLAAKMNFASPVEQAVWSFFCD
jgi:transposase